MFGRSLLIFLHGSGSDGLDLRTYLEMAPLPLFQHQTFLEILEESNVELLTPTAEKRRYSAASGEKMNVWFDRSPSFVLEGLSSREDTEGIDQSWERLILLIQAQEAVKSYDHYFLGGFSMGGGCCLHGLRKLAALRKLRGIFTMGSYLVDRSALFATSPTVPAPATLSILMMHGRNDELIDVSWGQATSVNLHLSQYDVQFRTYSNVYHELHEDELADALKWMKEILIKLNGETHAEKRRLYLESKYDAMTEEMQALESKILQEDEKVDSEEGRPIGNKPAASKTLETQTQKQKQKQSKTEIEMADHFPYFIEYLESDQQTAVALKHQVPRVRIHFDIPSEFVPHMTSRPVLACGSIFEIQADAPRGVRCEAVSSDPEKTALDISKRLFIRAAVRLSIRAHHLKKFIPEKF